MEQLSIGFAGFGLIGGSIAKAIRKFYPKASILAYDIDYDSLKLAYNEGTLSEICTEIDSSFSKCKYIFLCAPVLKNNENIKYLRPFLSPSCILTDVGSVKGTIHSALSEDFQGYFIGGHPMTGSEKSDYANSSERLLENAYYILTPEENVPVVLVNEFKDFIASLGALPVILDVNTHDTVTAAISHLPHLIAASLVHFLIEHDNDEHFMKMLAAGGFKDMTRIASSNVQMWQDICLTNTDKISMMLSDYINELTDVKNMLAKVNRNAVGTFFQDAKDYRDSMLDNTHGSIQRIYALYCDIPDEAGCIAKIAVLLADNNISIKNIGILHNREFEDGILRIEFYQSTSCTNALNILRANNYSVTERN